MPIYDFQCKNTQCEVHDHDIEIICKHDEIPQQLCKHCQSKLERVLRAPKGRRIPHISWSQWRAL